MDVTSLRWILVLVGIAIITAIFLFGNPDRKRKPRASRKRNHAERVRHEPSLDASATDDEQSGDEARQAELAIGGHDDPDQRNEPGFDSQGENKPAPGNVKLPDIIVTLFLQGRDNHIITGVELLDASLKSGLVFGDQDIFHRIDEEDIEPVFSMANLTNPGRFDKTAWNTVEIKGVTLFMTLPGPKNALDAWDSMLATARRLAELLHTDLLDDTCSVFTRERALQIKDELREYERQNPSQP